MNHFVGEKGVAGDIGRPGQTGPQGLPGEVKNNLNKSLIKVILNRF